MDPQLKKSENRRSTEEFTNQILKILEEKALRADIFLEKKDLKWKIGRHPFSRWTERKTANNDYVLIDQCVFFVYFKATREKEKTNEGEYSDSIKLLDQNLINENQLRLQTISTGAKNRAEYLTDRADFYPLLIALIGGLFGYFAIAIPEHFAEVLNYFCMPVLARNIKELLSVIGIFLTLPLVATRLGVKNQISDLKMMANILDLVDKRFPKPSTPKNMSGDF